MYSINHNYSLSLLDLHTAETLVHYIVTGNEQVLVHLEDSYTALNIVVSHRWPMSIYKVHICARQP